MEKEIPRFAGTEVVELAVQVERNGRDFYKGLVKKFKNTEVKELFSFMVTQEEQHIEDFKKILSSVQDYQPSQSYPEEYFLYIRAIASEHIFTKKGALEEKTKNIATEKEAVDVSIGLEKDSILFYQEMKKVVPENDANLIDQVILQEKDHLRKLWGLRSKV